MSRTLYDIIRDQSYSWVETLTESVSAMVPYSSSKEDINNIVDSTDLLESQKFYSLVQVTSDVNFPKEKYESGDIGFSQEDQDLKSLIALCKIEILLREAKVSSDEIQPLFNSIQLEVGSKGRASLQNSPTKIYLRIKSNDLLGDYRWISGKESSNFKLMELVNKKLNLISAIPDSEDAILVSLSVDLYVKVLEYCLLAGADFRKHNLLKFLDSTLEIFSQRKSSFLTWAIHAKLSQETRDLVAMMLRGRIISYGLYKKFLESSREPVIRFLWKAENPMLACNFMEYNVLLLPKYYQAIQMRKILMLFPIPFKVNVEEIVSLMILESKLPLNSCIDQLRGILFLGNKTSDDERLDIHIRHVCELVDQIANTITSENDQST